MWLKGVNVFYINNMPNMNVVKSFVHIVNFIVNVVEVMLLIPFLL